MFKMLRIPLVIALLVTVLGVFPAEPVVAKDLSSSSEASTVLKAWCGRLSSYTTWYYSTVERAWKPILYVWKGKGKGNPYAVSVYYNDRYVSNGPDGVQTYSGPQVDPGNGWVGYFIAKRFYLFNPGWDDDWRWEVRGCIP